MKSIYVLITMLLFSFTLLGQGAKVPKEVKAAFEKQYPNTADVKWSKEGNKGYEADFKLEGKNISVVLDKKGEIKETETSIPVSELPKPITPFIEKKHTGSNITAAYKIVNSKGKVTFETEITKGKKTKELIFDQDGKHITK
jgi:hypothetical protein